MNNSNQLQRKQITKHIGRLEEIRLETGNNQGMQSNDSALEKREREGDVKIETSELLEKILARENVILAMKKVIKNKGSHGVDGMGWDELRTNVSKHWAEIKRKLLEGTYKPAPVRRVEIPKPNGGKRMLGIPTVIDRMIQQAIAQELNKIYEPVFSDNSYGFRPGRSQHMAIKKAKEYINEGYKWVVDMDLEKYFDTVNHDILMERLSRRIKDKRVLRLIRKYLESGIMINGLEQASEEGVPQGGPLSPILSNIMLDEVDKELEARGHKFCRFADDSNIYVKSQKAGNRVLKSIKKVIEGKLKLKINESKSAVDLVSKRKFLGFSFYFSKKGAEIRIYAQSYERLKRLGQITTGWINYYGIANGIVKLKEIEGWIRRRLRACIWKSWKRVIGF
ncbi:MAG: group II intron reverse transcriptase/maturase [Niameybacter sp.]